MIIKALTACDPAWETVAAFAESCSWRAGAYLAALMWENRFAEHERAFAAFDGTVPVGFCTLTAKDEMPETCVYTPFIGFVFVDEAYRGRRIAGALIAAACSYAKLLGCENIYLTSDAQGFYEKYGFTKIEEAETIRHEMTQLFCKSTKGVNRMESHDYIVTDIQGDYAFLQQTDADGAEPFQVALALLPPETDTGTKLHGFMGFFEIVD